MNIGSTTVSTTSLVEENPSKRKYSSEISESIDRNVRPAIDRPSTILTPAPLQPWIRAMSVVEQPLQDLVTYGIIDSNERKKYLSELIPSSPDQINLDQWTSQTLGKAIQSIEFYAQYYSFKGNWKQMISFPKFSEFRTVVKNIIRIQLVIYSMTFSKPFKMDPVTKTIDWQPYIKNLTGSLDNNLLTILSERFSFPALLKHPDLEKTLKFFIKNYREYLMQRSMIGPSEAIQIAKADDLLQQTDPVMTLEFENGKTILLTQGTIPSLRHLKIDRIVDAPQELQMPAIFSKCPHLKKIDVKVWDKSTRSMTSFSFDRKSK